MLKKFDILNELYWRHGLRHDHGLEHEYQLLASGLEGEKYMEKLLKKQLPNYVRLLHDVELSYYGRTQIDFLLMEDHYWWVIEVKNYSGPLVYREGQLKLRGQKMAIDQLGSMRDRLNICKQIADQINPRIHVIGSFVMIHPDGVFVSDHKEEFTIVTRNQLKWHLEDIFTKYSFISSDHVDDYLQELKKFISPYPEKLPIIDQSWWNSLRKGFRCPNCQVCLSSTAVVHRHVYCQKCDRYYAKCLLVEHLYAQCCVLLHHDPKAITTSSLIDLSGGAISDRAIIKSLSDFIPFKSQYRHSYFENFCLPYEKLIKARF